MSESPPFPAKALALAEQLARPVTFLQFEGEGEPIAAWKGVPSVPLPEHLVVTDEDQIEDGDFFEHWISVDARKLPHALPGCLSVYLRAGGDQIALYDPEAVLHVDEGQALYGFPSQQVPHLDALFRHGPSDLQGWVAQELGTPAEEMLEWSELPLWKSPVLTDLDQQLRSEHPMWADERPVAQLGGWCWGWPDQTWDEREKLNQQLMLVTYEDSEPWVELWWTGQDFEVVEHLT
ncbi:hypothetical protein [Deinococcus hopiensis]|uniref:Uncharacterized protein n=1 Tax=Deinococcus hopiensis KR-140 TaxID=695939 RepID=A0A1W1UDE3_9DEIO|nr:hypothetical protein [Deinococcus hopiensis]SMB79126.1 hypothetical protein SAMN00790413_05777 [Deinococcus hopiensis KR-140]